MRPPRGSGRDPFDDDNDNGRSGGLRRRIERLVTERSVPDQIRKRVTNALQDLERVELGGRNLGDLILSRDDVDNDTDEEKQSDVSAVQSARLQRAIGRALGDTVLSDLDRDRLRNATDQIAQIDLGDGRTIGDFILDIDDIRPPGGGKVDIPTGDLKIDVGVLDRFVEAELYRPETRGQGLSSVIDGALANIRDTSPNLLPNRPLKVGRPGATLPLAATALGNLVRLAAAQNFADPTSEPDPDTASEPVIWDDGTNELLVYPEKVETELDDGIVRVTVPVETDAGSAKMVVPFAVGSEKRVTGLIAAAPDRPLGDPLIAEIWGEALIAFAYKALLEVADNIAGASGRDVFNDRLIAQGLAVRDGALVVQSQAAFRYRRDKP